MFIRKVKQDHHWSKSIITHTCSPMFDILRGNLLDLFSISKRNSDISALG